MTAEGKRVRRPISENAKRMKRVSNMLPVDDRNEPYGYRLVDGKLVEMH